MSQWALAVAFVLNRLYAFIARIVVRRGVKKEIQAETLQKDVEKREKAVATAYKEKRDVSGLSDSDLVDRLRRRGDDWGSL